MKSIPPKSDDDSQSRTDLRSLMEEMAAEKAAAEFERPVQPRKRPAPSTDFASLTARDRQVVKPYQRKGISGWLADFLTPFMILVMVWSIVYFLLDVRYVYTEVHDFEMRLFAFGFVLGVVAINRLVAQEGSEESFLYVLVFGGVTIMFTLFTTGAFGVGSVARGFLDSPVVAIAFNLTLVAFIWWLTNRLMHECCVDDNPTAAEVGILTGTLQRVQKAIEHKTEKKQGPELSFDPVDPTEWKKPEKKRSSDRLAPAQRLKRRHPGISIFYFSAPVMLIFALGQRVLQNGGAPLVIVGHVYVACYTIAALMLLMLTSFNGLREYFRARRVYVPMAIAPFWLGLGTLFVAMVLFGAAALPQPGIPESIHVDEHETDFFTQHSTFRLQSVASTAAEKLEHARFVENVGRVVLVALALFLLYGIARGIGSAAAAIARRRDRFPPVVVRFFNWLDRWLIRLIRLPSLPRLQRPVRISREVATCTRFRNPMGDVARAGRMTTANLIEYAYDAMCALALDLGVPRHKAQTPYEFIESFPRPLRTLREEAMELTHLYVQSAYAGVEFDERARDRLRKFWQTYDRVRNRVVR